MYEIVLVGNPAFNRISPSANGNSRLLSGSVPCAIRTITQLGHRHAAVVGSVGADFVDEYTDTLRAIGDPEHFTIDSDTTGGFELSAHPNGEFEATRCIDTAKKIGIKDIPDELLKSKALLLSPMLQEIDDEFVQWICDTSDARIIVDFQMYRLGRANHLEPIDGIEAFDKTHCFLDLLQVSQSEAVLFTGESDPFVSAELIVDSIAESCIVTLGSEGSVFFDGNEFITTPAFATKAVETYGAGAVHISAFASGLLRNKPSQECLSMAGAASSIKVEQSGFLFDLEEDELQKRTGYLMDAVTTH